MQQDRRPRPAFRPAARSLWRHVLYRVGLLSLVAAPACASAQAVDHNVPYGPDPAQTLDLYHPAGTGPAHLVVFLHGGGWVGGNKGIGRLIAAPLVAQGYVVASLGYRLAPAISPAGEVQDAALGIAYLLHNAARFGIAPGKFGIIGHSSGAHMVALLGTDATYLRRAGVDPASLVVVVTLDGVFDVAANLTDYPTQQRTALFGTDPAAWKALSPVDLLDSTTMRPHFCLVHEERNPRFVEQESLFEAALRKHGAAVETVTVPGLTHGQLVGEFDAPGTPMAPFVVACLGEAFGKS